MTKLGISRAGFVLRAFLEAVLALLAKAGPALRDGTGIKRGI